MKLKQIINQIFKAFSSARSGWQRAIPMQLNETIAERNVISSIEELNYADLFP